MSLTRVARPQPNGILLLEVSHGGQYAPDLEYEVALIRGHGQEQFDIESAWLKGATLEDAHKVAPAIEVWRS
jgi:hypothetical protein